MTQLTSSQKTLSTAINSALAKVTAKKLPKTVAKKAVKKVAPKAKTTAKKTVKIVAKKSAAKRAKIVAAIRKGFASNKLAPVSKTFVVTPKLKKSAKKADEVGHYNSGSTIRYIFDKLVSGTRQELKTLIKGEEFANFAINRLARHGLESGMWKIFVKSGKIWMAGKITSRKAA